MTTTAIDSNVLIDIVSADPTFGLSAMNAVDRCAREGSLIISPEVVAEFATGCQSATQSIGVLEALNITYRDIGLDSAAAVGEVRSRRNKDGRILADYMIALHATAHADRLLTRDTGFNRMGVPGLVVVTPTDLMTAKPDRE